MKKQQPKAKKQPGSLRLIGNVYKLKLYAGTRDGKSVYVWKSSKGYRGSDGSDLAMAQQMQADYAGQLVRGEINLMPDTATAQTVVTRPQQVTVGQLLDNAVAKYEEKERKSTAHLERRIRLYIRPFFRDGALLASQVNAPLISHFIRQRQKGGAKNATVNRDLAAIKFAFRLGLKQSVITADMLPYIEMLPEHNTRTGFLTVPEYDQLREQLPLPVRPLLDMGFWTGVRRGEAVNLRFSWIDWDEDVIRIPGAVTKNGKPRVLPLTKGTDLRRIIEDQLKLRNRLGSGTDYVFFWYGPHGHGVMDGDPIRDFRDGWKTACTAIGRPGLLYHDLRRSAIKVMRESGVPDQRCMEVSGHLTRAVFDRYFQSSDGDIVEVGSSVQARINQLRAKKSK